eukprot:369856-Amphidinium_carterae.1
MCLRQSTRFGHLEARSVRGVDETDLEARSTCGVDEFNAIAAAKGCMIATLLEVNPDADPVRYDARTSHVLPHAP